LSGDGTIVDASFFNLLPQGDRQANHQRRCDPTGGSKRKSVPLNRFSEPVESARWASHDGFIAQVPLDVRGQAIGRLVTPSAFFLQTLHHNPIQIASEGPA